MTTIVDAFVKPRVARIRGSVQTRLAEVPF